MEHTVKLTDTQRQNLITFLMRVQLTGEEVPAYVSIVEAINSPFLEKMGEPKKAEK